MTNTTVIEQTKEGIYYREWKIENPKAVILLVHGLGEHCQRYEPIVKELNESGFIVSSMDLPHHGCSEGKKGHIPSFDIFEPIVLRLTNKIKSDYPQLPVFILGHSMGGLITTLFISKYQDKFNGAILSGPAIDTPQKPPQWQVATIKTIAKIIPSVGLIPIDASMVSRDPKVVQAYNEDPLVNNSKLTSKLLVELSNAMDEVKLKAQQISLPILVMHGQADQLTDPKSSEWLIDNISSKDKTLRLYEGLYHEIFNEPEAPQIYQEVIEWLDTQLEKT